MRVQFCGGFESAIYNSDLKWSDTIEFREVDTKYEPTGKLEPSFLWSRNNQMLIDKAIKAVQDNNWSRVMVQCVERPGKHGGPQGII